MEFGYFCFKFITLIAKLLSYPFRRIFAFGKRGEHVSEIEDPLLLLSATKVAKFIRERQLKSETIIKAYIGRITSVNPIINAVVEDRFHQALEEAKNVDAFLSQTKLTTEKLASKKPLLGVPVTIKESCAVKGLSLVAGFTFMKGTKAQEDGAAVSKLKEAGAIILLVSTTSELCLSVECENLVTGRTRNPYDTTKTSGGSSGGEGALIGSGASIIGIGSDMAGSVRIPAMFCGIFAHKPTARLVSCDGHWPSSSDKRFRDYIAIGPLTRYAEDLKLMTKVLSESGKVDFEEEVNLNNTTLCFMEDIGFCFGINRAQEEIRTAVREVVNYLKNAHSMKVSEEKFEDLVDLGESCLFSLANMEDKLKPLKNPKHPEMTYTHAGQILKHILPFGQPEVTWMNVLSDLSVNKMNGFLPKSSYPKHEDRLKKFRQKFINVLGTNGVLIMPTYPSSAFGHGDILWQMPVIMHYTFPFNILGLPSTQVPIGFDRRKMPIGVQVISTPNQDRLCFKIAEVLEKRFGGWQPYWNKVH